MWQGLSSFHSQSISARCQRRIFRDGAQSRSCKDLHPWHPWQRLPWGWAKPWKSVLWRRLRTAPRGKIGSWRKFSTVDRVRNKHRNRACNIIILFLHFFIHLIRGVKSTSTNEEWNLQQKVRLTEFPGGWNFTSRCRTKGRTNPNYRKTRPPSRHFYRDFVRIEWKLEIPIFVIPLKGCFEGARFRPQTWWQWSTNPSELVLRFMAYRQVVLDDLVNGTTPAVMQYVLMLWFASNGPKLSTVSEVLFTKSHPYFPNLIVRLLCTYRCQQKNNQGRCLLGYSRDG